MQATANGVGLANTNNFTFICANPVGTNFEVKNLKLLNAMVWDGVTPNCTAVGNAVYLKGVYANSSVHNCSITNAGNALIASINTGFSTNFQAYSNNFVGVNWGISSEGAGVANPHSINFEFWANRINVATNFNTCPSQFHADALILGGNNASGNGTNWGWKVYRNYIWGDCGTNATAAVYGESTQGWEQNVDWMYYNNVVIMNSGQR